MRNAGTFATIVSLAVLVAGCSGMSRSPLSPLPVQNGMQAQAQVQTRPAHPDSSSGVAPQAQYRAPIRQLRPNVVLHGGIFTLAVSDFGTSAVELLNNSFQETGTISSGLVGPDGDAYDSKRNLYVSDNSAGDVQEYGRGATSPTFTYSTGLNDAVDVTTDSHQSVYVSDYNFGSNGYIVQYPHRANTVTNECTPGGGSNSGAESVAVNSHGDVFVSYNTSSGGAISEYRGGLSGCHERVLAPALGFAGGLTFDKKLNLIACDQTNGRVVVIGWPMYSGVKLSFSGFSDPFHVTLDGLGTLLYVADVGNADVAVLKYPSGESYTTLGSGNGLVDPAGVAAENRGH